MHVEKFKKSGMGHMFNHFCRGKENGDEPMKRKNEAIDRERTHLNYNLAAELQPMKQAEFLAKRLGEVHVASRKNLNVFCSWIITLPGDVSPEQEDDFFKESFNFMQDRYGQENVISAYVHRDETTPHMHFAFVPIVYDKVHQRYKVSSRDLINRTELRSIHRDLAQHLEMNNIHCSVLNEATKSGNKSIDELRNESKHALDCAINILEQAEEIAKNTVKLLSGEPAKTLIGNIKREDYDKLKSQTEKLAAIDGVKIASKGLTESLSMFDASDTIKRVMSENKRLRGVIEKKENDVQVAETKLYKVNKFIEDKGLEEKYEDYLDEVRKRKIEDQKFINAVQKEYAQEDAYKTQPEPEHEPEQRKKEEEYTLIR